ncbi:hypothetical protein AMTRI_Chr02g265740 [Amborella trichopoda]
MASLHISPFSLPCALLHWPILLSFDTDFEAMCSFLSPLTLSNLLKTTYLQPCDLSREMTFDSLSRNKTLSLFSLSLSNPTCLELGALITWSKFV